ncbi:Armadillo-type fold domain containing protein [Cordyceps militaris CM01]|uniref:Armadillo-type fold domain containing protein n=1 Tax=Cordyceps militaris (strain CM01) TaxID=983644 RepID=G3JJ12_CORMM|nr:Armadillo-type fold domain containing protein [Cordyceps militaris CM01]EGX91159.1 Armadillo-type fold domain containing protein [Cordyceps militaris CM01]
MTPQDIADLLQREGRGESTGEYDATLEEEHVVQRRTELLAEVLKTCKELRASDQIQLEVAAEKLGDGSRDEAWRLPYGDSGILSFFLEELAKDDISNKLKIHSLRIVGNSCADINKNRALMVENGRLEAVIRQLRDESVVQFTIPVLYNVMVDYEPAQTLASELKISQAMVKLLTSPNLSQFLGVILYFCRILALLVHKDAELAVAADDTVSALLSVAIHTPCKDDVEEFASLGSVAIAYLAAARFQQLAITRDQVGLFLDAFHHAHTGFDTARIDDPDLATALTQLRTSMLNMIAELTAQDAFPAAYPVTSAPARTALTWLSSGDAALRAAACFTLGNLSRSDAAATALVEHHAPQTALAVLLADPAVKDAQLLHAALSLLKNLAIPAHNKPALRPLLDPVCVPHIYALDALPQVQYAAVSLTRLLLSNCPDNVSQFCSEHIQEGAAAETDPGAAEKSDSVGDLIALFRRTDTEPTKVEAARAIAAICRVLHSNAAAQLLPRNGASDSESRAEFYTRHDVGTPLAFLVTQDKWHALRSEAWFVLALMSRSPDGSRVIAAIVQQEAVSARLSETITGRKADTRVTEVVDEDKEEVESTTALSAAEGLALQPQQADPKQKEHIAAVERENALVMCTELLRNWTEDFQPLSRGFLEGLLKDGTELVVAHRSKELSTA